MAFLSPTVFTLSTPLPFPQTAAFGRERDRSRFLFSPRNMRAVEDAKNLNNADSPTSVLEDEELANMEALSGTTLEENGKSRENSVDIVDGVQIKSGNASEGDDGAAISDEEPVLPLELEAKNGDCSLITETMAEEERLLEARVSAEESILKTEAPPMDDHDTQFSKLDELLTQTKLYSEFLLEKMDNIILEGIEPVDSSAEEKKGRRGRKRKAAVQQNQRKVKTAVAAMLNRSEEGASLDDSITVEERTAKEQAELVPLLTGGKLKPYQLKGVKWLISLWQNGLNGILADQMGLGKTIQTIGFLAHLKGMGLHGPYLVIAPLSTLSNWVNEITRFTPSINAVIYHGTKGERQELWKKLKTKNVGPDFPFIITSFAVVLNDAKILASHTWKYVVVDEGHRLKNADCKLLREMRRLSIENKLLLTGTPLQNNLAELWSLLNFILPNIFPSYSQFESWFDFSGKCANETHQETEEKRRVHVVSKLHSILRPFLLRRVKEDVEKMLPQKKEIILYANMTECQKEIQNHLINKTFDTYLDGRANTMVLRPGMRGKLNNLLMQLRKNCNHPDLLESAYDSYQFYPPIEKLIEQCGKFRLLDRLLTALLSQKHKVLIFSQFTKVLDLIDYFLSEKGLEVCRIDGGVKLDERKKQIEEFNDLNSNIGIFLLSTRAGGLGINLTAADTCILYDSDWNPQMDLQAMDRCHRIGQTRPVHIYRLATSHSVEGRMLKRAFSKLRLEHVVIGKGQFEQERTKTITLEDEELVALLQGDDEDERDNLVETDISIEDLMRVLDRSDLVANGDAKHRAATPLPLKGPGWEVVIPVKNGGGMLSAVGN